MASARAGSRGAAFPARQRAARAGRCAARYSSRSSSTFDGWHLYDLDFVFSAHLAGVRIAVCNDLCLIHNSIGAYAEKWDYYVRRFLDKHRGRLQRGEKAPPAEPFWLEMTSTAEWLLVTEERIATSAPT